VSAQNETKSQAVASARSETELQTQVAPREDEREGRWGFLSAPSFWRPLCALAFVTLGTQLMNGVVFPLFDPVFSYARDISVTAGAVVLLALGVVATFRPETMRLTRTFNAATALCLAVGAVLLLPALMWGNAPLLVFSSSVLSIGRSGLLVGVGLAATGMGLRETRCMVALAFTCGYAAEAVLNFLPMFVGLIAYLVLPLVAFILIAHPADDLLEEVAGVPAPADLAITRPSTFLPLASQLFVCLFLFKLAFGYSLRFGEVAGAPVADLVVLVPIAILAVVTLFAPRVPGADLTAEIAFLLIIGGFFMITAQLPDVRLLSNVLLNMGSALFEMLMWVVLISLAGRNRAASVSVFAWGRGVSSFGTLSGAALGVFGNALVAGSHEGLVALSGVLVMAITGYALIGLRRFSFEKTVEEVQDAQAEIEASIDVAQSPEDEFNERCAAIADKYGLTQREREVFGMLARGRDRTYIEEQLVISKNTVKAHVKHIYAKLDIHSQQDLIDVFEAEGTAS
jgi:DNA-binding CsgD family transcriptional regulator